MSSYVAVVVLLSGLLIDFTGTVLVDASRLQLYRRNRWGGYEPVESSTQRSFRNDRAYKRQITDEGAQNSHLRQEQLHNETEVENLQNSSVCNYVVESFPKATDFVEGLKNIRCVNTGTPCQDGGPKCCIQTYTHITIKHPDGNIREKILTGCVCGSSLMNEVGNAPVIME